MSRIKCFDKIAIPELADKFNNQYKEGMSTQEQREIGTKIALDYHKQLHDELQDLRKKTTGKKPDKYVSPDKSKEIEDVIKAYEKPKQAESKPVDKKEPAKKKSPIRSERPLGKQEEKQLRQEMADSAKMQWAEFNKKHPDVSRIDYMNLREDALKDADGMDKMLDEGTVIKTQDGLLQTVSQYIDNAQAVLDTLFPGMKVVVFQNASEYVNATGSATNSGGVWKGGKEVFINMEAIRDDPKGANTPIHEAIHPIVEHFYALDDTQTLDKIWDQVQELQDAAGLSAIKEHINRYRAAQVKMPNGQVRDTKNLITTTNRSTTDIQAVEGITELLTMVADGRIDPSKIPQTTWGKLSKIINDIFNALGISFRIKEPNDLRRLAEGIQKAFQEGDANLLRQMIAAHSPNIKSDLKSFDNLLDEGDEKETSRKIKEIIEKYPDLDPQLLKDYIKEKTGWKQGKINMIFDETGVANVYLNDKLRQWGFDEYVAEPEQLADWVKEADAKIAAGYDAEALIASMDKREPYHPTKVEYIILAKYLGALSNDIESNPTPEKLEDYRRKLNIIQKGKTEVARSMAAMAYAEKPMTTLADYITTVREAAKRDLTQTEFDELTEKYNREKEARIALEEKVRKLEEEATKKQAEAVVNDASKKAPKTKKTKEDFEAEKQKLRDEMKRKLNESKGKLSSSLLFGAERYIAIAPEAAKYVKVLAEEGINNIRDMLENLRPVITDVIPDATDKDILDILAGKYDEAKPERKEVAEMLYNIKTATKIVDKIAEVSKRKTKNDKQLQKKNREIEQLNLQLAKIKIEPPDVRNESALTAFKKRMQSQISKLNQQLQTGDFADKKPSIPVTLDDEAKKLRKEWVDAKKKKELALLQAEYDSLGLKEQAMEIFNKSINVPRTLMATGDLSMVFIQGGPALAYTKEVRAASGKMASAIFSQENFDNHLREMKDSPRWELMQALDLAIVDPDSPFSLAQDELFFARNYVDRAGDFKVLGTRKLNPFAAVSEVNKASERAYVMYLNKLRFDIFNKIASEYEDAGMTYENRPDLYKATAKFVNNITGKGNVPGWLKPMTPIFSALFFSPGMIASRVSLMKSLVWGGGMDLPKELRGRFRKDMGKFVGSRMMVLGLIAFAANLFMDDDDEEKPTIEIDPRSSDFGLVKIKNTRFNVWGGFQGYAKFMAQFATLEQKSTKTGEIVDMSDMGAYSKDRGDLTLRFLRGKASPIASYVMDMSAGEDYVGRPIKPVDRTLQMFVPMFFTGAKDVYKDLGIGGAAASFPATFLGITSNSYEKVDATVVDPVKLYDKKLKEEYFASPQQMDEYVKVKDSIATSIYARIQKKGGFVDIDDYGDLMLQTNKAGEVVFGFNKDQNWKEKIPVASLTNKQKQELRRKINAKATRDAKKKVFKGAESKD